MRALIFKEIRVFFSSLIGYVVIAAFLLLMGLFLWVFPGPWNILSGGVASMDPFFTLAPFVKKSCAPIGIAPIGIAPIGIWLPGTAATEVPGAAAIHPHKKNRRWMC